VLLFDIGANRGDATLAGLKKGYKVIAIEPAPKIYKQLVSNFIYNPNVVPLKLAVSNTNNKRVEFYEAEEDGLSTLHKAWLTSDGLPYAGKPFRTITATTITLDELVELYGQPELIKIDVEGAEWLVFQGMTKKYGILTFEWTEATLNEHSKQLEYLQNLGYEDFSIRFIEEHLKEPDDNDWLPLDFANTLNDQVYARKDKWESGGWKEANLRPTGDVGMIWVR
jgi:FkbM family methyltransferase